ncbi:DegT/DnrJ/EryC1/StrS family aminotransferase [Streptomyces sp. NPDC059849]|uniref:DegT/DnrJ/EryC1/StrS family aminotransferase n=1 Tax=Streptomyces sp. NPDC059849 TaxID=3346969 RepID=UPI00364ECC4F
MPRGRPRTRGDHRPLQPSVLTRPGPPPARAGTTSRTRTDGHLARDHPRTRGGHKPLSGGEGGFVLTDDDTYYRLLTFAHYNKRAKSEIPAEHPLAAALAHDQLGRLDGYLAGRAEIADHLTAEFARIPGFEVTPMPDGVVPSWYGLTLTYHPGELGGLSIERFHQALVAEGATEFDRPGSTCPMNQLPLYQHPATLFPGHPHSHRHYKAGDFPVAEHAHAHAIKLLVWHREQDLELAKQYVRAAIKISDHHKELL